MATLALAAAALTAPRTLVTMGTPVAPAGRALVRVALAAVLLLGLATVAVLAALVRRARTTSPTERRQLVCLLPSAALFLVGLVLDYLNVPGGWLATVVALPLGLSFAILQYRLYDLDLYIHRGVVWLLLITLAVATFAGAVTLVEGVIAPDSSGRRRWSPGRWWRPVWCQPSGGLSGQPTHCSTGAGTTRTR